MLPINATLANYIQWIEQNSPFPTRGPKSWQKEYDNHLNNVGKLFCQVLDLAEKTPVVFNISGDVHRTQKDTFDLYFKAAGLITNQLSHSNSTKVKTTLNLLAQRVTALRYRIEPPNGGLSIEPVQTQAGEFRCEVEDGVLTLVPVSVLPASELPINQLTELAAAWKSRRKLCPETEKKLSPRDLEKLEEVCRYHEFVKLLLKDKKLQSAFFTWTIRDNNGVRPFVEFPATTKRVHASHLGERIGKFGGDLFAIKRMRGAGHDFHAFEKVLCLPFNTTRRVEFVNILDESQSVELNGGWKLTIKQIIDLFARKHEEFTDLEFFGPLGITNWHSMELGSWNPQKQAYDRIDLSSPDWWQKLPVFEEISREQLEARYGVKVAKGEPLVVVSATRAAANVEFEDRHSYLIPAIPVSEDRYRLFPLGEYPPKFPSTIDEKRRFLTDFVAARIAYPDYNDLLSKRQHAFHPVKLDKSQCDQLMESLREDLLKVRNNQLKFELDDENCGFWTQSRVNALVPKSQTNFFLMEFSKMQSRIPAFNQFLIFLSKLSTARQKKVLQFIYNLLGRKKEVPVIKDSKFNPDQKILTFQPGVLHKQIEEGKLKGRIHYGVA